MIMTSLNMLHMETVLENKKSRTIARNSRNARQEQYAPSVSYGNDSRQMSRTIARHSRNARQKQYAPSAAPNAFGVAPTTPSAFLMKRF